MKSYSLLLLLIAAMNMVASSQGNLATTLSSTAEDFMLASSQGNLATTDDYIGSGNSDLALLPSYTVRTSTSSKTGDSQFPTSKPLSTPMMNPSQTDSLTTTVLPSSTTSLPTPSVLITSTSPVLSSSLAPISPSITQPLTTTRVTLTTSVTRPQSQFSASITTEARSINLSNTNTMSGVPLPVLIGAPAGGAVIISAIFIVCVLCCVRCRMRRKYTLKTARNGSGGRRRDGRRSATPVVQDLKDLTVTDNSKKLQGFGLTEETTAGTFGIEFPETPKYGSNEDIPALIILNPVKAIEPTSNALWSQTLPTRQKIRKQTCSESDVPDQPDPGVLKPAKSIGAIDTMTRSSDAANKINDGTSMTLLLPDEKKKDNQSVITNEHEYDHLSPEDFPDLIGSNGYVFLEPGTKQSLEKSEAEASAPDVEPKVDEDAIYLQPSSLPVPSQPPQSQVPIESTATAADTESVYDTPKSSGIDTSIVSPQENKQSISSGPELSSISSREISVEVPSHYDVPKSVLSSFKQEAPKELGFSAQPNSGSREVSQLIGSPQENHYDSLGSHHTATRQNSPPYYDIPKHLLMAAKNGKTTAKKLDSIGSAQGKETDKDNVQHLESSDEHVYCVPPDVAVNVLNKSPSHKPLKAEVSQTVRTEVVNSSSTSKPVPMRRKKNDNTARNSIVPAPRPNKRPKNLPTKSGPSSVSSSLEDLLQESAEPKKGSKIVVPVPKPAVAKKPKVMPISSTASVSSSSEDILQEKGRKKITVVPATKPAKKPKNIPKIGSGSVTSSCEELLQDQEQKDDARAQNVTVNGEKPESNCTSTEDSSKPKPIVVPRSQSRQGIVQELLSKQTLQQTSSSSDVPGKANLNKVTVSPKRVAPKRPPIPQRPAQRPPPVSNS